MSGNPATAEALELLRGVEALRDLDASSLAKLAHTATIETVQARRSRRRVGV